MNNPSTQQSTQQYSEAIPNNAYSHNIAENEIDFLQLGLAIWQKKWKIIIITFIFSVLAILYTVTLPNVYRSQVLLAPVSEKSDLKIPGQLGGLAALAGVDVGGGEKTALAIEVLKSREFIGKFIEKYDLLIPLMASNGWDRTSNNLKLDDNIYSVADDKWVRDVDLPFKPKPSLLEAHEHFMDIFNVTKDKDSGMFTLTVEHYSPYLAKKWADLLVVEINNEMRDREFREAENSINYLTKQIEKTNLSEVRIMLFSLIEEQTKTVMLTNVRDEYIFSIVDPAIVPERKVKPSRAIIVSAITLFGLLFTVLIEIVNIQIKSNAIRDERSE